jgi:Uma2 family endonuclease
VRAPEIAFVRQERVGAVSERESYWPGAPDLAVEVISPSDLYTEVDEQVLEWLAAGTQMVVVVNPRKRTATVYRSHSKITILTEEEVLEGADVIPGWQIAVRDIFV